MNILTATEESIKGLRGPVSFTIPQQKQLCKGCESRKSCVWKHFPEEVKRPCPSYLESNAQSGGGALDLDTELERSGSCGHTAVELEGGGFSFYKRIRCRKLWCPECGGKGGVIHQYRLVEALRRVVLADRLQRYFVFTVPEQYRQLLLNREVLNGWYKGIRKLMRAVFPGENETIFSAHYEGERNIGKWHPHMNVLSFTQAGRGMISEELLIEIKGRYARMLAGLLELDHIPEVVDVRYRFETERGKMLHKLKYSLRPMGEDEFFAFPVEVQRFIACDLKGFQHVRYGEELKGERNKELLSQYRDASEIVQGAEILSPIDGVTPLKIVGFVSAERMSNMERLYKKIEYPGDMVRFISPLEEDG